MSESSPRFLSLRVIFRPLVLLFIAIALVGCKSVTLGSVSVDVSFANTDKGYVNSAADALGTLYLYDKKSGTLRELAVIDLTDKGAGDTYDKQEARDIDGIEISGELDAAVKAVAKTKIQSNAYIVLENAYVEKYQNTFTDLAREIRNKMSEEEDLRFAWFLDEAASPDSRYRHVLVYSAMKADKIDIGYDNNVVVNGKIKIPTSRSGSAEVAVTGASFEKYEGKAVPVLLKYHVIRTTKERNREGVITYHFRLDPDFEDQDKRLLIALKK